MAKMSLVYFHMIAVALQLWISGSTLVKNNIRVEIPIIECRTSIKMIQYRRMSISAKNVNYLFVVYVFWHIYNMGIDKIQLPKNLSFSKDII